MLGDYKHYKRDGIYTVIAVAKNCDNNRLPEYDEEYFVYKQEDRVFVRNKKEFLEKFVKIGA